MFILDKNKFHDIDLTNAKDFIEFWKEYYSDTIKIFNEDDKIIYINELNLNNDLTETNLKRLLRWKDSRWLTEKILSGQNRNQDNEKVVRVLKALEVLNDFRHSRIKEDVFFEKVQKIFPNGYVWRIFLLHISRPHEYPIADRYVFHVFSTLNNRRIPEDWDGYKNYYYAYKEFFFNIALSAGINGKDVPRLKEVDNALWAFGKFLYEYNK